MYYRLRDGLSWCLCGGHAVFLDLVHDRYFRLPREDDLLFQRWALSEADDGDRAERLVKARILVASLEPSAPQGATSLEPPTSDIADEAGPGARWIDIVKALVAQRGARAIVKRGRLPQLVADLTRASHDPESDMLPSLAEMQIYRTAAAFASPILGFNKVDQCLPRAIAAQAMSRAFGVVPTLVFGVRLEPFAAHCWLQWGAKVVVGDLEQARMFTPILAVP